MFNQFYGMAREWYSRLRLVGPTLLQDIERLDLVSQQWTMPHGYMARALSGKLARTFRRPSVIPTSQANTTVLKYGNGIMSCMRLLLFRKRRS